MQEWIEIIDDFFPKKIVINLLDEIKRSEDRKITCLLDESEVLSNILLLSEPTKDLMDAVKYARDHTKILYNIAILKRYNLNEYTSAAYDKHLDPWYVSAAPLFMCTLEWEADLSVWTKDWKEKVIPTKANRLIIQDETLEHAVTPPKNESWLRYLLFLGIFNELVNE